MGAGEAEGGGGGGGFLLLPPLATTLLLLLASSMTTWLLSAIICFPPLLGWKQDHDMGWFYDLLEVKTERNLTQAQFLEYVDNSGEMSLGNFTQTLETVVYPQCGVSDENLKGKRAF